MALSVAALAGFPVGNSALLSPANGTPTDAAAYSYTPQSSSTLVEDASTSIYTPGSTTYVAGFLDNSGGIPPRIFGADNGSGSRPAVPLPTLVSVTLIEDIGGSIQEFGATSSFTAPGGFIVEILPAPGTKDGGVYPLGYPVAGAQAWTLQGGAYTNANAAVGYPNPVEKYLLSFHAILIIASTQYG